MGSKKKKGAKSVQIFLQLSKIVFVILCVLNLTLTVNKNHVFGFCFFNFVVLCIWFYGFLSSLGFFKTVASEDEDGTVVYDTHVPFLPVSFVRLFELGYYNILSSAEFNVRYFTVLVILDVLYTVLLLIDKSTYYYVSLEEHE